MMKELFQIVLGFLGAVVFVWLFLKVGVFLVVKFDLEGGRKVEIQTLFHGNIKDEDQI
jgi:hypothetical protein